MPEEPKLQHIFRFQDGPIIVICPDAPEEVRGSLAEEDDPNFTKLQQYGDLDALIELYGHLCRENPTMEIFRKLASEVVPHDYAGHVILLGGIGWNKAVRRIGKYLGKIPIKQIDVTDLPGGDIFQVEAADGAKSFYYPESEEVGGRKELVADVAYIARLPNPFQFGRTLTICNGIHSRGVLGAVRCFTDPLFVSTTRSTWRTSFQRASSQYCCESEWWETPSCHPIFEIPQPVCMSGNRRVVER